MGFITNNANVMLLFLIVASATILVAATVYFQTNFNALNTEYNEKLAKLNEVSRELEAQEAILKKVKEELTLKSVRESEFTEKYTGIKSEKEQLEMTKEELEKKKTELEADIDEAEKRLIARTQELESKETQLRDKDAQILSLNNDITLQKAKTKKAEKDLTECVDAKSQCTCP